MATQISLNDGAIASAGALAIQTNGTTQAVSISTGQVATVAQNPILTSGTANGVAYLNGSKALTTGSALVFDGTNLGVGVTPSAWTRKAIQLGDAAAAYVANNSGGATVIATNMYFDGSNKYATTAASARYSIGTGTHEWYNAASGTADAAITFTQAMTLDASGNLGLNNTSPTTLITSIGGGGGKGIVLSGQVPVLYFEDTNGTDASIFVENGDIAFVNGTTEAARFSSGNLLVGTTSAGDGKVRISASANAFNLLKMDDTGSTGGNYIQFLNSAGAQAGSINHNGTTSVNYGSGSDYRLKDITGPVTNAADFINSLKPKVGTWKADGSKFVGFLAHEFAEVCPQAVVGEKDGVDADGNPIYQSMEASSSEVIANMVSLLQEQQALITTLTARITALESA